ncbi:MAG: methylthioribulose 1-phosphate dehydratase [Gammaproteobacteria bacterium]
MLPEFHQYTDELIEAGRLLYMMGIVPATSGNFSAKLPDDNMLITVSGRNKGRLERRDIMLADARGNSLDGNKPSAETLLHVQIYNRFRDARCVMHPHSVNATLLSMMADGDVVLRDYEILKAFPGINTHECKVTVPVFANDQDMSRLSTAVETRMKDSEKVIHGYLIRGHGFYTWGNSVEDALRHVEAFEFLFDCEMRRKEVIR